MTYQQQQGYYQPPSEWQSATTLEGKLYYFNTRTKETSWTPPQHNMQAPMPAYQQQQQQVYQQPPAALPYGQPNAQYAMQPPQMQFMSADIGQARGVVLKQITQTVDMLAEAFSIPYEAANKYKVALIPPNAPPLAKERPADANTSYCPMHEEIKALPEHYFIQEESDTCLRIGLTCIGGLNLRPLKLHFYERGVERFLVDKPCACGGCCCCPFTMTMSDNRGQMVGQVKEDFDNYCGKCCASLCCGFIYHKILDGPSLNHKYTLKASLCCCDRVDNCCGATCCRPALILDILDTQGKVVAVAHKVYAKGQGCSACCRCLFEFDNFILEFPPDATPNQRALLLTSLIQLDFQVWERKGGDNNGGS